MKIYELNLQFSGKLEEKEIQEIWQKIKKSITGKILKEGEPKKLMLAYPIKREISAFFNSLILETSPENVVELKEILRQEEKILRYLVTIRKTADIIQKRRIPEKFLKKEIGKKEKKEKKSKKINKIDNQIKKEKEKRPELKKKPKIKLEDIDKSLEKLLEKEL
jgi:ribosomal protein S6